MELQHQHNRRAFLITISGLVTAATSVPAPTPAPTRAPTRAPAVCAAVSCYTHVL